MKNLTLFTTTISCLTLILPSCKDKETTDAAAGQSHPATIELLTHSQGKFTIAETVTISADQSEFKLGEHSFLIKNRWDDAEMTRETTNTNPREAHAVELAWSVENTPQSRWIFPTSDDDAATMLTGTTILPRLLPPGARITTAEQLQDSLLSGVQFEWQNKRYSLPEAPDNVGQKAFPGWKIAAIRLFKHALLDDSGKITESDDTSFANRAVEVTIESVNGSKERHIVFIDHPKLTSGIHPTLLPVSRISGDQASLSRLVVCETLKAPAEKSHLLISPAANGAGLQLWSWEKEAKQPTERQVTTFPVTLEIDGQKIELTRHWNHARRQIKWGQRESGANDKKQPALLIETGGHMHSKQFVLIDEKTTPCEVTSGIIMLRYRTGSTQ